MTHLSGCARQRVLGEERQLAHLLIVFTNGRSVKTDPSPCSLSFTLSQALDSSMPSPITPAFCRATVSEHRALLVLGTSDFFVSGLYSDVTVTCAELNSTCIGASSVRSPDSLQRPATANSMCVYL